VTFPDSVVAYASSARLAESEGARAFLPEIAAFTCSPREADCCVGWGYKRLGRKARRLAERHGKPYWALEDGFIRSVGLGKTGARSVGMAVDKTGIYYDCSAPSDLENLLNSPVSAAEEERAASLVAEMLRTGCTKYNVEIADVPAFFRTGRHVVLADQTVGDASVRYGGGSPESFKAMAERALAEYPGHTAWIKTHPDVAAGKARGYLHDMFRNDRRFRFLSEPVSVYRLAQAADAVFSVSGQFGFDALLAGAKVYCFGLPFYAGWGLTVDCAPDPFGTRERRTARPSKEALAYAALIAYCRYRDPFSDRAVAAEEAVDILCRIKSRYLGRAAVSYHCVGFSGWKHPFVRRFLESPYRKATFHLSFGRAVARAREDGGEVAVWASKEKGRLARKMREAESEVPVARVEDGFIRSFGLGSALLPACSLALDRTGIYYDARRPSDLEAMLNRRELTDRERERGRAVADHIVRHAVTKYGVASRGHAFVRPETRKSIHLVIGQVADDASIRCSPEGTIASNAALLEEAAERFADGLILYRPHPDVAAGYRKGHVPAETLAAANAGDVGRYSLGSLLMAADHVHTISSLVGMEALCYGKRVHVYGSPFYAGWGLTRDRIAFPRRVRMRSLEELAYIAFCAYPLYVDPVSLYPCEAETLLARFDRMRGKEEPERGAWLLRFRWQRYVWGWRNYRR
jgi:capsular polysaccharide export protein